MARAAPSESSGVNELPGSASGAEHLIADDPGAVARAAYQRRELRYCRDAAGRVVRIAQHDRPGPREASADRCVEIELPSSRLPVRTSSAPPPGRGRGARWCAERAVDRRGEDDAVAGRGEDFHRPGDAGHRVRHQDAARFRAPRPLTLAKAAKDSPSMILPGIAGITGGDRLGQRRGDQQVPAEDPFRRRRPGTRPADRPTTCSCGDA